MTGGAGELMTNFNPPERGSCTVAVLERNPTIAQRAGRVLRAASSFASVAVDDDPARIRDALAPTAELVACDGADLEVAVGWARTSHPRLRVLSWTSGDMTPLLDTARAAPELVSLVGWPSFASMPRPWELSLATRRVVEPAFPGPRLADLLAWGATAVKYRPRTTSDRDVIVAEVGSFAEAAGAPPRLAQRIGEVSHEMLMNAMYDAPASRDGAPLFAHDRTRSIELEDAQAPTFRFAADGAMIGLQVTDPFGRLTRARVLEGIVRGRSAGRGDAPVLDTSGGGAGLGLYRIYALSTVMIVEVVDGVSSTVTALFDQHVNPREARSLPVSLHLFFQASR